MDFYNYAPTEQYIFITDDYIKENCIKEWNKYISIFSIWNNMTKEEREEVLSTETEHKNVERIFDLLYYKKISIEYIKETIDMGTNIDRTLKDGTKEDGRLTCCFLLLTRFIELVTLYRVTKYLKEEVNQDYSLRDNPKATHLSVADNKVSTSCDFTIYNKELISNLYIEQQQVIIKRYMNKDTYLKRLIFKTTKFFNYKDTTLDVRHLLKLIVEQEDGTYKEEYYIYKIKNILNEFDTDRIWVTQKRIENGEIDKNSEYYKIYEKFGKHSIVFIENIDLDKHCTRII